MEYKKFLTEAEYKTLIKVSVDAFNTQGDIEGFRFNPVQADAIFFRALCSMCIDNLTDEMYEEYFNTGKHRTMLDEVVNANEAYYMYKYITERMISIENIIDMNLQSLIKLIEDKIPDKKSMAKLVNKLPKEWQKAVDEHQNIIHPIIDEAK